LVLKEWQKSAPRIKGESYVRKQDYLSKQTHQIELAPCFLMTLVSKHAESKFRAFYDWLITKLARAVGLGS
jgi:hypothetical protein